MKFTALKCKRNDEFTEMTESFDRERNDLVKRSTELAIELGAKEPYIQGNTRFGYQLLGFKEKPTEGKWRDESSHWVPDARSNAGKSLRDRIHSYRMNGMKGGLPEVFMPELSRSYSAGLQEVDGQWYAWYGTKFDLAEKGIDLEMWEPCKASEVMLALESLEESHDLS